VSPLERDDAALVAAYAAGDPDAFAELWTRHQRYVHNVAHHLLGRASRDADDMTQEVAVRLLHSVHTWAGRASFRSWLYTVTSSVVYTHLRTFGRRPRVVAQLDELGEREAREDPGLATVECRKDVTALLELLAPDRLDVVVLVHHDGVPQVDVAVWLGVPVGTVKSRCARGLAELRRAVAS